MKLLFGDILGPVYVDEYNNECCVNGWVLYKIFILLMVYVYRYSCCCHVKLIIQ